MKSIDLRLSPDWIKTESLTAGWYINGQMSWYMELKDGKLHGYWKQWGISGELYCDEVYENDGRVKRIV